MEKDFTYYMPTKIVYGQDKLDELDKYINGRKALLITSTGFIKRGLVDRIKSLTSSIVYVISNIKTHPEFIDLETIYNSVKDIDFEIILAVGGGSVLDASKFISVQNDLREYQFVEDIVKGKIQKKDYNLIPIISIPTTAGTGSEITPWATIWDMIEKKKYSLHLPELFSETAIYDPLLTLSVPKEITIQTGLDTLSHALESIWNKNANEITINYAVKSARLIIQNLVKLSTNLDNIEYRDNIMKACMYAGLAFSNTQTAIAHGMSYYITANKGIPHGIACSFTLPLLIDSVIGKYHFIDDALTNIFGELSSNKLRSILKELSISTEFKDYGISDFELKNLNLSLQNNQRAGNSLVVI
ncbi:MAG: Alcohol dehydrogenase (EC [uncultured Campylobacterales bacterium]|uniref:Alcohol dehydrogenase (EC) n=1 Tax=uncultured Campylobacterales bacterium TaxID=352960 RepID=A0A6S6TDI3_9BACT|nr:MAG: Alcohol dehydrogenase (EC [uncultured Campylobacterales bacterium]